MAWKPTVRKEIVTTGSPHRFSATIALVVRGPVIRSASRGVQQSRRDCPADPVSALRAQEHVAEQDSEGEHQR